MRTCKTYNGFGNAGDECDGIGVGWRKVEGLVSHLRCAPGGSGPAVRAAQRVLLLLELLRADLPLHRRALEAVQPPPQRRRLRGARPAARRDYNTGARDS